MSNQDSFDNIAHQLSGLVGENEIAAREFLGNEQYDKITNLIDTSNALGLAQDAARVKEMEADAFMRSAIGILLLSSVLLGTVWSFVAWFK